MARVKNEQVRKAILDAAAKLFEEKGYIATTIGSIAKAAGTSQSNVYVYFSSKIEIAFAVFDPWMRDQISALETRVLGEPDTGARLPLMVHGLLEGVAGDRSGQTLTLVQALATARPTDNYSPDLLNWTMDRIGAMMGACLPATTPDERHALVQALILAFDGVALRQNLRRTDLDEAQSVQAVMMLFSALSHRLPA
ncbi:TetR/AcrR family transcriptional regulator [Gemmobacter sp.]|uniref:TetR/AcrR family transcriptional regulator n=1 Tax=Gemmobacter sp. TaxID=1898957 RepID=UPI002AFEB8EA|nr:TetR/AcrR family transcriptional regulator [Gemmobacter sp.]